MVAEIENRPSEIGDESHQPASTTFRIMDWEENLVDFFKGTIAISGYREQLEVAKLLHVVFQRPVFVLLVC